ncbi:branched-chain amino acid transporter permease [Tannockella kyphosi]|uniref:branched-chain amino acid transporter permease n=1 Tax=Tannockella kyphosi TaxID=2899121 RepID=UPI0020123DEE|nr:AzlD domain-containing protein [Tannockella kyphosi]
MTTIQCLFTIIVVALGTMFTRFISFLVFPDNKQAPNYVKYLGTVLPYASISLIIVYCLKDALFDSLHGLPEFLGIAFVVFLHLWKKNTLISILLGTLFYMFLVQVIF